MRVADIYQILFYIKTIHCVKSVQIRNYFSSVFFCIRTEYLDWFLYVGNTGILLISPLLNVWNIRDRLTRFAQKKRETKEMLIRIFK